MFICFVFVLCLLVFILFLLVCLVWFLLLFYFVLFLFLFLFLISFCPYIFAICVLNDKYSVYQLSVRSDWQKRNRLVRVSETADSRKDCAGGAKISSAVTKLVQQLFGWTKHICLACRLIFAKWSIFQMVISEWIMKKKKKKKELSFGTNYHTIRMEKWKIGTGTCFSIYNYMWPVTDRGAFRPLLHVSGFVYFIEAFNSSLIKLGDSGMLSNCLEWLHS